MKNAILNFPKQFEIGIEKAEDIKLEGPFKNVVVTGMGGSAIPANIILTWLENLKTPLYIHRTYGLPPQASEKSLVVCISFSGNTEETISALRESQKRNFSTSIITTGGELEKIARESKIPLAEIPKEDIQPRCASGYLFGALSKILFNSGLVENKEEEIIEMARSLNPQMLEEKGKKLAEKIAEKIPVVYASQKFKYLARIWKIKFNENSKTPAFWNYFPELNHNEMVGFERGENFHLVILKDEEDHPKVKERMELTAKLLGEKGLRSNFVALQGKNKIEKIFNNLILSDWTSYYLALKFNIDPEPVKIVEDFKKRLGK